MIYPESNNKSYWDILTTLILLITCCLTPYNIAFFGEDEPLWVMLTNSIIDSLFFVDILVIFNTAYYDEDMKTVDSRPEIFCTYAKGWFSIDLIAIIPFDHMVNSTNMNSLAKVTRVGRLYKLVKLTRLLRVLKIMKEKSKLLKYINGMLKIGLGFERLFFFVIIFTMLIHIGSCMWVVIAVLYSSDYAGTWIEPFIEEGLSD